MTSNQKTSYTISELAQEFDVSTRTLRFYEEKGIINPMREGQKRIYTAEDRVTLKLIFRGKRLGFSLDESVEIIKLYNPKTGSREQLETLMAKIQLKQKALRQQQLDIDNLLFDLNEAEQRCVSALKNNR